MNREDVIRMASECDLGRVCGPLDTLLDHEWEDLHRFAELVASAEREECAKVCEDQFRSDPPMYGELVEAAEECAFVIRARGGK